MRMDDKRNHYKMDAIGLISILQNNNNCLFVFFIKGLDYSQGRFIVVGLVQFNTA